MSKKTAPKKTKKPTIADDLHVLKESFEAQAEFLIDWRKRLDDRLTALESRSAPAEAWVPKVGDWVVALPVDQRAGSLGGALDIGSSPIRVKQIDTTLSGSKRAVLVSTDPRPLHIDCRNFRPATLQEIASHKAKEEQRALEAEWAKFDCLQEGDACHLTDEQRAELAILFPNVLVWEKFRAVVWYQESLCYIQREIDPCDGENEIPAEHFLRRAKGTIAKRAEVTARTARIAELKKELAELEAQS